MSNKDNHGAAFKNKTPRNSKSPNFQGQCTLRGVDFWIAMWQKTSKTGPYAGSSFYSISITPQDKSLDMNIQGALFRNAKKNSGDDPDYEGYIEGYEERKTKVFGFDRIVSKPDSPRRGEEFFVLNFEVDNGVPVEDREEAGF